MLRRRHNHLLDFDTRADLDSMRRRQTCQRRRLLDVVAYERLMREHLGLLLEHRILPISLALLKEYFAPVSLEHGELLAQRIALALIDLECFGSGQLLDRDDHVDYIPLEVLHVQSTACAIFNWKSELLALLQLGQHVT